MSVDTAIETMRVYGRAHVCTCCGCLLAPYEVFVCQLRGLKKPVCLGCLVAVLVWMKSDLIPMLEAALEKLGRELHPK